MPVAVLVKILPACILQKTEPNKREVQVANITPLRPISKPLLNRITSGIFINAEKVE